MKGRCSTVYRTLTPRPRPEWARVRLRHWLVLRGNTVKTLYHTSSKLHVSTRPCVYMADLETSVHTHIVYSDISKTSTFIDCDSHSSCFSNFYRLLAFLRQGIQVYAVQRQALKPVVAFQNHVICNIQNFPAYKCNLCRKRWTLAVFK